MLYRQNCTRETGLDPLPENPSVSVVITLFAPHQIPYLKSCVDGVLNQTYDNIEICICPETDEVIQETVAYAETLPSDANVSVNPLDEMSGVSEARNNGAEHASGDIVAFIDVDAVPNEDWVEKLVQPYIEDDVLAVGGRADAAWEGDGVRPRWLPPAFDWLVGANHDEFGEQGEFVRNTFGCNCSFRRDVFLSLDGYDTDLGKEHGFNLQGEEPAFGAKLQKNYNTAVYYEPAARINHAVSPEQQTLKWLLNRAYLQGVSKKIIGDKHQNNALAEENEYLRFVLLTAAPRYLKQALITFSPTFLLFTVMVFVYTFFVGLGYLRAIPVSLTETTEET